MRYLGFFLWACAVFLPATSGASPLSLAGAQRIAEQRSPSLQAQDAAVRAIRAQEASAGELPDPKLILAIDNLPTDGPDRFNLTRDSMTMRRVGVMQEFAAGDKRRLRSERATAEAQREAAVLAAARLNVRRDAAFAWLERHFAERQLAVLRELARESELQTMAMEAAVASGKAPTADPLAARLAALQVEDRILEGEKNVARATLSLERWVGTAAHAPLDAPPSFDRLSHRHEELTRELETHPHLAMYAPMQAVALAELRLADAARRPDWSLEVGFAQRGPAYSNMLSIGVRVDLPIFQSRRQDPQHLARQAQLEQARSLAADALRVHAAEVATTMADWSAAKLRVERYRARLLPLADERKAVALAAYRGGRSDLTTVIDAHKAALEIRINELTAQAELARAWAQLEAMLPETKERP
ncbi:MAG: TolC family protein [Betaproteobacteria bacterium]|nr:TolC family protein [Betaproteobacteria bacterium]